MKLLFLIGTALAAGLVSGAIGAQTVYKCTSAEGVKIFSSQPCGRDAKATRYQTLSPEEEASQNDASCRRSVDSLTSRPDSARIDAAHAEMDALTQSSHHGTPAENEAWLRDARARMENLKATVRQEEARIAEHSVESRAQQKKALADCDKKRADRDIQLARQGT